VSFIAIGRVIDGIVGVRQRLLELALQVRVVLGQEAAHRS